ncbi:MAG: DHHA1 domain-containing protein, partial [Rhodospirillales bacterium]|nr:DHHA1 domain-containing protein [Rhodospirillales bacterium]
QMGDAGEMQYGDTTLVVTDTRKLLGTIHAHYGEVFGTALNVGDEVALNVDHQRRSQLQANHSATHLLHEALRRKLGGHVMQKGSLVASDRLRFDVSHPKAVEADELLEVEAHVNAQISNNAEVVTRLMEPEAAVEAGAMALFGEKYGDEVRVVSMGADGGDSYSTELCGGTHVSRTGDIGVFKILNEGAVASGVRRIEALTGDGARAYFADTERSLMHAASLLKSKPVDVPGRVEALIEDRRKLERELVEVRRQLATGSIGAASETKNIGGVTFAPKLMDGVPAKELKGFVDDFKNQLGSGVVAVVSNTEGKASLVVGVTDDLKDRLSAVDLVRVGCEAVGGKGGGGRPDMAQAGGPNGDKGQAALDAIEKLISIA